MTFHAARCDAGGTGKQPKRGPSPKVGRGVLLSTGAKGARQHSRANTACREGSVVLSRCRRTRRSLASRAHHRQSRIGEGPRRTWITSFRSPNPTREWLADRREVSCEA